MFGKGMGNMTGMMKKVQKMQADMKKMQEELKTRTVEASVGGGAVTVVMNGEKIIESLLKEKRLIRTERKDKDTWRNESTYPTLPDKNITTPTKRGLKITFAKDED